MKKAIDRRFGDTAKLRAKKQQETSLIVDSDLSLPEVEEIVEVKVEDEQHNYTPLSDEETAVLDKIWNNRTTFVDIKWICFVLCRHGTCNCYQAANAI